MKISCIIPEISLKSLEKIDADIQSGKKSASDLKKIFQEKLKGENFEELLSDLYKSIDSNFAPESSLKVALFLLGIGNRKQFINYFSQIEEPEGAKSSDSSENEIKIEGIYKEFRRSNYQREVSEIYGSALQVNESRLKRFKKDFIRRILIRINGRNEKSIVKDNSDLQRSIIDYKAKEFKKIEKFLLDNDPSFEKEGLYKGNGKLINLLYFTKTLNRFKEIYLSKYGPEALNSDWLSDNSDENKMLTNAVNAYINLKYFDNIVKEEVKLVKINPSLTDMEVGLSLNGKDVLIKYLLSNEFDTKVRDWSTSEYRDGIRESSVIVKLLIQSMDVRDYTSNAILNAEMNGANIGKAWNSLIKSIKQSQSKVLAPLKQYVLSINSSPFESIYNILSYIFDGEEFSKSEVINKLTSAYADRKGNFTRGNGLETFDINILYSLYKEVFDQDTHSNIIMTELNQLKNGDLPLNHMLLSELIPGFIIRNNSANYLETIYDQNEKGYVTRFKSKYNSRKPVEDFYALNNSNFLVTSKDHREQLLKKYGKNGELIYLNSGNNIMTIQLGGKSVTVQTTSFFGSSNLALSAIKLPDGYNKLSDLFNLNNLTYSKLLKINQYFQTGNTEDEDVKLMADILGFISDMLNIDMRSMQSLNVLVDYLKHSNNKDAAIKEIFTSAVRAAFLQSVQLQYEKAMDNSDKYVSLKDWVRNNVVGYKNTNVNHLFTSIGLFEGFRVVSNKDWVDNWFLASASYTGANSKSVTRNLSRNNIANFRPSSLVGQYLEKSEESKKGIGNSLLFVNNERSIIDYSYAEDAQSKFGITKSVKNMNTSELMTQGFAHNFLGAFANNGTIIIQPTVYSDKTAFSQFVWDLKQEMIISGIGKIKLSEASNEQLEDVYSKTIGKYYLNKGNQIAIDLTKILAYCSNLDDDSRRLCSEYNLGQREALTLQELDKILRTLTKEDIRQARISYNNSHDDKVNIAELVHYVGYNGNFLQINPLHIYYQNLFTDPSKLHERVIREQKEFIKQLIAANVIIYNNTGSQLSRFLNEANNPFIQDKTAFISKWVKDGAMVWAFDKDGNAVNTISGVDNISEINPLIEKYFYLDAIGSGNLKYMLVGSEDNHKGLKQKAISKLIESTGYESLNDLALDPNYKDLYNDVCEQYIAAAENAQYKRNVIVSATIQTRQQKSLLGSLQFIKVAAIEDTLGTAATINGEYTNEQEVDDGAAEVMSYEVLLMNGALGDQSVSFDVVKPIGYSMDHTTGTMSELKFAAHTLNNASMRISKYSKSSQYKRFRRNSNQIWDDRIQNLSIVRHAENRYEDEDGWHLNFGFDIAQGDQFNDGVLSYEEEGKIYSISDLIKINYNGDEDESSAGIYVTYEEDDNGEYWTAQLFDENGDIIRFRSDDGEELSDFASRIQEFQTANNLHTIRSTWELWQTLGGLYSGKIEGNEFVRNEASHYAVVNIMNNFNLLKDEYKDSDKIQETQDYFDQPLKSTFISYNANITSLKCGQFNVNPKEAWSDDTIPLETFDFDTTVFGPQQDAYHTADEAEMSEFTQVISSVDAGGRTHWIAKEIFNDLGKVSENILRKDFNLLEEFVVTNSNPNATDRQKLIIRSKLYHLVAKELLDSGQTGDGLGINILNRVKDYFKIDKVHTEEDKIPFSDPNIYSQFISSYITHVNKGIKRKHPGIGNIISPSYDKVQLWHINGVPYTADDLIRESAGIIPPAELLSRDAREKFRIDTYLNTLLQKEPYINAQDIEYLDIVKVYDAATGLPIDISLDLSDIMDYYRFKEAVNKNESLESFGIHFTPSQLKFKQDITKPRNLRPQRFAFDYKVGDEIRHATLFDLDEVRNAIVDNIPINANAVIDNLVKTMKFKGYDIIEESIINEAAETVTSNIYKTKLNQGDRSLNDILLHKVTPVKIPTQNFKDADLILHSSYGKSALISFVRPTIDAHTKELEWTNVEDVVDKHGNHKRMINIDNESFEIGRFVLRNDIAVNSNGKFVKNGDILDNATNLHIIDDQVYEEVDYITKYRTSKLGDNGKVDTYTIYHIDQDKLKYIYLNQNSEKEFKISGAYKTIANTIATIYDSGRYNYIQLNNHLKDQETTTSIVDFLRYNKNIDSFARSMLTDTYEFLKNNPKNKNLYEEGYKNVLNKNQMKLTARLQQNFELSRYLVAARIPAQSLQSYMQMKIVGYVNTSSNIAYVSSIQTLLQGSDYDIDKAYMMGFSFDDNGNFINWSPSLFNFRNEKTLQESLLLPTPSGKTINNVKGGIELDDKLKEIHEKYNNPDTSHLAQRKIAQLISYIDGQSTNDFHYSPEYKYIMDKIIEHESYQIPNNLREDAIKNSVSGKIQHIVRDIRNIPLAQSSITTQKLRDIADRADQRRLISSKKLTGMNPATKAIMQTQNMVGKEVIGIAAVGEKVFMGLSYYFNEKIRQYGVDLKLLQFYQRYNRIQGRASGVPQSVVKTSISDINFENIEEFKNKLCQYQSIKEKYLLNGFSEEEATEKANMSLSKDNKVDLMISQLLSAATDNAKELVLKRINAGSDMAGLYIHLMILGFSIDDIAEFMTSDAVETIAALTNINMYDEYDNDYLAVRDLTGIAYRALGSLPIYKYGEYTELSKISGIFKKYLESHPSAGDKFIQVKQAFDSNFNLIQMIESDKLKLNEKLQFLILESLEDPDILNEFDFIPALKRNIIYTRDLIQSAVNRSGWENYLADIIEFLNIQDLAKETTILGTALMGINKGISTKITDINRKVNRIEKFFSSQEGKFGLSMKNPDLDSVADRIMEKKPFYTDKAEVLRILNNSKDIINSFSFSEYLINDDYKKRVIEYYNLIKSQYNIFDVMNTSPQYTSAMNAFKLANTMHIITSVKSKVLSVIQQQLREDEDTIFLSQQQQNGLQSYAETLVINSWLKNSEITFPAPKQIFSQDFLLHKNDSTDSKSLTTTWDKMSFKRWIEQELIPDLMTYGEHTLSDGTVIKSGNNAFLKHLIKGVDNNKLYYRLDINLSDVDNSLYLSKEFQNIINGLVELDQIKIGQYSVADYLALYNIMTSYNRFGNEKLTKVFKTFAEYKPDSLINDYFKYVGSLDFKSDQFHTKDVTDFLKSIGYNSNDALVAIAPIVKSIKINKGKYVQYQGSYYKWNGSSYSEYDILPDTISSMTNRKDEAVRNLLLYGAVRLPSQDLNTSYKLGLMSDEIEDIERVLIDLFSLRRLMMTRQC